jgi:glycine/D-amino acid oxidase-like deaminating enzyme
VQLAVAVELLIQGLGGWAPDGRSEEAYPRQATPSGAPIFGPVDGLEGLLLATGHHRNGILLSAITGRIVSALALGEPSPVDISPFLHARLTEGAV